MKPFFITSEDIIQAKKACSKFNGIMSDEDRFYELCFVLCAPQAKIESNIILNKKLRDIDFYHKGAKLEDLVQLCKLVRFKNRKAQYLLEVWDKKEELFKFFEELSQVRNCPIDSPNRIRYCLTYFLNGLSYKTASQFLRNAYGIQDLAILDVHILRWLGVKKPPVTYKSYEKIEKEFQFKAYDLNLKPVELDAIIFVKSSGISWDKLR